MAKRRNKRKAGIFIRLLSLIFSLILILFTIGLVIQIIRLNVLPIFYVIPISVILISLPLLLIILLFFKARRGFSHFILTLCILVISIVFGIGNYYVFETNKAFKTITDLTTKISNTMSVRVLNGRMGSKEELEGCRLGYFSGMNQEDLNLIIDEIGNIDYATKSYDDLFEMVEDLYDGNIDGILFNESYSGIITADETYCLFMNQTNSIASVSYYTENENQKQDSLDDVDVSKEPFTVLISGNDSYGAFNENSRSDMNMLVTVNPKTATVLMTSIPRDFYIPIAEFTDGYSDTELEDKLTHSGLYGISTTEKTLENLLQTDINYYVRVNFSSVVNLVDALGGIDVYVEDGLAVDAFYADTSLGGVEEGWNHLNGARALAFSRERHAYEYGDNQRVKNQQIVLEAIISSLTKPSMLLNYPDFVSALAGAFETNMPTQSMSNLLKFEFGNLPKWKFESYSLSGYGDSCFCPSLGGYADVVIPDESSVLTGIAKIEAVKQGNSSQGIERSAD
ncbi:LCP family protein [Floccifex sp.]|uniref:LCP family protein n=1 Tax=Floccifex sp. TaxID=2815810 RepID=UPI003F070817